jgi:hypothetical protein
MLAGGVSIALGIRADRGALLIAAFAFPTAVLMHGFWREADDEARQMEQAHFLKDIALAGAAVMLIAHRLLLPRRRRPRLGDHRTAPRHQLSRSSSDASASVAVAIRCLSPPVRSAGDTDQTVNCRAGQGPAAR